MLLWSLDVGIWSFRSPPLIELNHIFLFLAIISPIAVLIRAWQREMARSWRVASFIVLAITGLSYLILRRDAGFIGAGAWFVLLFLPAVGLKRVAELSAWHRYADARRLTSLLRFIHPGRELRDQETLFRDLEKRQTSGQLPGPVPKNARFRERRRLAGCWAVSTMIIVNVIYFAFEGWSSTDSVTLLRLGAVAPYLVTGGQHQYWRLITALFLHYGPAHLLFNLFALYVLGPALERAVGGIRFLVCYLISGLGSTTGVMILMVNLPRLVTPNQLVGASGCVMGVVGALAGFLLRDRHIPQTRAQLQNILLIIGIQVLFDISTPQVSTAAHLCGLVTGFALGIFL